MPVEYPSFNPKKCEKFEFTISTPDGKLLVEPNCSQYNDDKENISIYQNENFNFFFEKSSRNKSDSSKLKALNYLKMKKNQCGKTSQERHIIKERSISSMRSAAKESLKSPNKLNVSLIPKLEKPRSKSKNCRKLPNEGHDITPSKPLKFLKVEETESKRGASCACVIF